MMTTDTVAKVAESAVESSTAQVVGIAKGVGMIEPDMATMIAVILTDAEVPADELDATFRRVVERTFNCVSIDTDTSTSDTAIVMASGAAGPVRPDALERALESVATELARKIAADGEGATTLIEVVVDAARDWAQAKRVAKSIVNSPLVKTAVHGADPNWGRVAMAVGKCGDDTDIDPDQVVIRFGTDEVYPARSTTISFATLSRYPRGRRGADPRQPRHRRRRRPAPGAATPRPGLHQNQRRLHDLAPIVHEMSTGVRSVRLVWMARVRSG
ncbi:MAG: bifunctional ornithine acetyltransferase/N-acetylglutamate synthase [Ilumatobacteraceae bacterium]